MKIISHEIENDVLTIMYEFKGDKFIWILDYIPKDYKGNETDWDSFCNNHVNEGYSEDI